ncbi:MAG: four helix bundle protein [Ignavibacteriales bacterium]|jgi:four helix bundle protein|nr:MAG: four helix bundle protein [Ignavibacteriales bacterium]
MKVKEESIKYGNVVLEKSFYFSVRILKLYRFLLKQDRSLEPILKQILRSGTSIGANITEAQNAPSTKDFINKLNISLKEARESEYWLNLFKASDIINEKSFKSLQQDCKELIKLLIAIIKTAKSNSK